MKQRGLGKGLSAIFAENTQGLEGSVNIKISEIEPNREQPRKEFDTQALSELADSISAHGVLQPLLLRPMLDGSYRIVAGERRWRASRMAGLTEVPAVIREMTDTEEMIFALIENLQREDLTALEEARGYKKLIETQSFTQEEVSQTVGKSRPVVANALRLLNLPADIQQMLENEEITAGHARTILGFKNEDDMRLGAKKAANGATVRELEALVKKVNEGKTAAKKSVGVKYFEEARIALGEHLGRKIKISGTKKKGTLQIEFYGEKDLEELLKSFKARK